MEAELTQQLAGLTGKAIGRLDLFFEQGEFTSADIAQARIATSLISAYARLKSAEGAREATTFQMARELANDKAELRRYIEATMPQHSVVKALKAPTKAA